MRKSHLKGNHEVLREVLNKSSDFRFSQSYLHAIDFIESNICTTN